MNNFTIAVISIFPPPEPLNLAPSPPLPLQTASMRKVTHFMMNNWNRDGTCEEPKAVMKMIDQLYIAQRRTGNQPIVVHGM